MSIYTQTLQAEIDRVSAQRDELLEELKTLLPVIAGQARGQSWAEWMIELGIAELKARALIARIESKPVPA